MKQKKKILIGRTIAISLTVALVLCCFVIQWLLSSWSNLSMDEIIYHLKAPLEGTSSTQIWICVKKCVIPTVLVSAGVNVWFFLIYQKGKKKVRRIATVGTVVVAALVLGGNLHIAWNQLGVAEYLEANKEYSYFIDEEYVDPASVTITFPETKRNLIYIFLESMEITYADEENGGAFSENVIPELTSLAQQNENFSGLDSKLNGANAMPCTTWTAAAIFAQTAGLPLKISIDGNSMDTQDAFFPSITALGDILADQGYQQAFLCGSDATFGGRKLYFTDHRNFDILDYSYAQDQGVIPEDYYVWWGYEDEYLFEIAKETLLDYAEDDEPFNLMMLTVDTHFENGYVCNLCGDEFGDNQYSNVMACSSRQVSEFVSWIQTQDFYENTTIVLAGDHLTMDSDFCVEADEAEYQRKEYVTYINAAAETQSDTWRDYTTLDFFPTTLAALGVDIEGERLGLGTNLFSDTSTLLEKFGSTYMTEQMNKKSHLMEELANITEIESSAE